MIQRFLTQRPVEPFDVWGRIGRAVRDGNALNAHDVRQPHVQVATITTAFLAAPLAITELAKDPVVVVDQETLRPTQWLAESAVAPRRGPGWSSR